jgi:hypothetical protein
MSACSVAVADGAHAGASLPFWIVTPVVMHPFLRLSIPAIAHDLK